MWSRIDIKIVNADAVKFHKKFRINLKRNVFIKKPRCLLVYWGWILSPMDELITLWLKSWRRCAYTTSFARSNAHNALMDRSFDAIVILNVNLWQRIRFIHASVTNISQSWCIHHVSKYNHCRIISQATTRRRDKITYRTTKRLIALSLGIILAVETQFTRFTCPRPFLLRPWFLRFTVILDLRGFSTKNSNLRRAPFNPIISTFSILPLDKGVQKGGYPRPPVENSKRVEVDIN